MLNPSVLMKKILYAKIMFTEWDDRKLLHVLSISDIDFSIIIATYVTALRILKVCVTIFFFIVYSILYIILWFSDSHISNFSFMEENFYIFQITLHWTLPQTFFWKPKGLTKGLFKVKISKTMASSILIFQV